MGCSELQRIATSHFFTSGSEVRDYHCTDQARDRGGRISVADFIEMLDISGCVCVMAGLRGMRRRL